MDAQSLPFYVDFNPVAFSIGPLSVHWYGLCYLAAFLAFWWLGKIRSANSDNDWTSQEVGDFLTWGVLGVIIGGRLGYVLFYDLEAVLAEPIRAIQIHKGGMSFHGGLLGVLTVMVIWAKKTRRHFFDVADFLIPLIPIGLGLGRLGNFIGGELWGRVSDVSWAMIFPNAIEPGGWASESLRKAYEAGALNHLARHPSQLYQMVIEGLLIFTIVWWFSSKPRPRYTVSGLFLLLYGLGRFIVEFVREPDAHLGFLAWDWLTMGQVLSTPMIAAGLALIVFGNRNQWS